jgi:hypothetical protein
VERIDEATLADAGSAAIASATTKSILEVVSCGRPLPGRVWAVSENGAERFFCGADCELLFRARSAASPHAEAQ